MHTHTSIDVAATIARPDAPRRNNLHYTEIRNHDRVNGFVRQVMEADIPSLEALCAKNAQVHASYSKCKGLPVP